MKFYSILLSLSLLLSSCRKETAITTKDPKEVTSTTVVTGGYVEGSKKNKVIKRGVCWGQTPSPGAPNTDETRGYGFGEFDSFVTGLKPATHYYLRAYALTEDDGYVYGNEVSFTTLTPPDPSILQFNGASYQVYTQDQYYVWGLQSANTTATSTTDGNYNTQQMMFSYQYGAASACANLTALGYSDWFLPSKDQLNAMYKNRAYYNFQYNYYWSSTQYDQDLAWTQNMGNGQVIQNYKTQYGYCRCIRKK